MRLIAFKQPAMLALGSAAIVISVELLAALLGQHSFGAPARYSYPVLLNWCLVFGLCAAAWVPVKRAGGALALVGLPLCLAAAVHGVKLRFLSQPLFLNDLTPKTIAGVVNVLPTLAPGFLWALAASGITLLAGIALTLVLLRRRRAKGASAVERADITPLGVRVALAVVGLLPGALIALGPETILKPLGRQYFPYSARVNSRTMGFAGGLFVQARPLIHRSRPGGYNARAIARIVNLPDGPGKGPPRAHRLRPPAGVDVIVVLAETLWDPLRFKQLGVTPDPIPFFRSLMRPGRSGLLVVPGLGGGTVYTEFEVLTGLSTRFIGGFPYTAAVHRRVPSLASAFRAAGHQTRYIHAYRGWFYDRDRVMPLMGFEHFLHDNHVRKHFPDKTIDDNQYIRDRYFMAYVRDQLRQRGPHFIFASTYGTHGPFQRWDRRNPGVRFKVAPELRPAWRDRLLANLRLLRMADNSLRTFLLAVRQRKRPTLVVVFGDHLPNQNYLGWDWNSMTGRRAKLFECPFIVWSNYPIPDVRARLTPNYLAPYILRAALRNYPVHFKAIERMSRNLPVVPVGYTGTPRENSLRRSETVSRKSDLHAYFMLQYDILHGAGYSQSSKRERTVRND